MVHGREAIRQSNYERWESTLPHGSYASRKHLDLDLTQPSRLLTVQFTHSELLAPVTLREASPTHFRSFPCLPHKKPETSPFFGVSVQIFYNTLEETSHAGLEPNSRRSELSCAWKTQVPQSANSGRRDNPWQCWDCLCCFHRACLPRDGVPRTYKGSHPLSFHSIISRDVAARRPRAAKW